MSCREVELGARHGGSRALPPHPAASSWILPCHQWGCWRARLGHALAQGHCQRAGLTFAGLLWWGTPTLAPWGSSITAWTRCSLAQEAGGGICRARCQPGLTSLLPPPVLGLARFRASSSAARCCLRVRAQLLQASSRAHADGTCLRSRGGWLEQRARCPRLSASLQHLPPRTSASAVRRSPGSEDS